jgi:hypothetical protein
MMVFRSSAGISDGEMYSDRISKARSAKERSFHDSQLLALGISSGM